MPSADYLCKQFGPRSGPTKRRPWSGSKLLGTLLIFPKDHFRKSDNKKQTDFETNISRRQHHDKLPRRLKESMNWNGRCYMYMHVSCLSLIFACFQYTRSRTPIDFYNCVCACVCVCQNDEEWGLRNRFLLNHRI